MAVYAITGKLGSGKGKGAIARLREYVRSGKRVATNCDVFMEHLDHKQSRGVVMRLPDKPKAADLYLVGSGNKYIEFTPNYDVSGDVITASAPLVSPRMLPGFDECHNGALVLDECGSWLNTRNFQDKGRAEMLEWCIHARKYGWDIYFIMQNISQVDKQLRESLLEYVVRLNRLDRMKLPVISALVAGATAGAVSGAMPRMHIAVVRLGSNPDGLVADRWFFRGDDLNKAYNTTQVFTENYPHGPHSLLSPWHHSGQLLPFVGPVRPATLDGLMYVPRVKPPTPPHKHMTKFIAMALLLGCVLGGAGAKFLLPAASVPGAQYAALPKKFSDTLTAKGYFESGGILFVMLSDGRTLTPVSFNKVGGSIEAQITPELWVRGSAQ